MSHSVGNFWRYRFAKEVETRRLRTTAGTLIYISSVCRWQRTGAGKGARLFPAFTWAAAEARLLGDDASTERCIFQQDCRSGLLHGKAQKLTVPPSHDKADHVQGVLECTCTWWEAVVAWKVGVFPCWEENISLSVPRIRGGIFYVYLFYVSLHHISWSYSFPCPFASTQEMVFFWH